MSLFLSVEPPESTQTWHSDTMMSEITRISAWRWMCSFLAVARKLRNKHEMTTLRHLISCQGEMAEELPLVHTTLSENLPGLVISHEIRPTFCPVFRENLVYFFYGRPAYRSSKGRQPGEDFGLCPVCFVFRPQIVSIWDLRLRSVATTKDLLDVGRNLIIVALVGADLHIRIFDASGKKVVDKAESELIK